jgi:hypothetical protein
MNITRREALTVGAGATLSLLAATGLGLNATGHTYRGVRYRILANDGLELNGTIVDRMVFSRVDGRYVSHLLCYSDHRDPMQLARGLIDGRHDRLFEL